MKRRGISILLALALVVSLTVPAMATTNVITTASVIDGGQAHSIALSQDGEVYVWGDNSSGQLGLGEEVSREDTPTKVPDLTSITAVTAGYNFSMALRFNGTVVLWGNGIYQTPTDVEGLENVVAISAGQINCLALTADGRVFQWIPGQRPEHVYEISNVVAVSAGAAHCMALTRSGEVWTWGANDKGQLGIGSLTDSDEPQKVEGIKDIIAISGGVNHSLAVDFNGNVYAWGDNAYSQLGVRDVKDEENLRPMEVPGLRKVVQVSAGYGSSLARNADGQVYSWGYGEYGQLGTGSSDISKSTPSVINRTSSASDIACGVYHNLMVMDKNGRVNTWGRNHAGQLGIGKNGNTNSPAMAMNNVVAGMPYSNCVLSGISSWAEEEIRELYAMEIAPPTSMDRYQEGVTRAELAHLLVTVYESTKSTKSTTIIRDPDKFTDIEGHSMKDSILKAYTLGIINGTSETTFNPEGTVSRQEAVTMLCRFVGKMTNTTIPTTAKNISYYDDAAQVAEWAAPYVDYAYNHNIMQGSDGRFSPTAVFSVEQSLLTVARLVKENGWKARQ